MQFSDGRTVIGKRPHANSEPTGPFLRPAGGGGSSHYSQIAISLRLDDEALRALNQLEASGLSRSEAIRRAIIDSAARLQQRKALADEVAALEADEMDRQEMPEIAAVMESMRAAG